ncbi:cyclin-Y-like protein 2 [Symphalangus syndactylus]|uniref:cyclin-Y-like protein 2 n=1 Tax=Symphalangus syndactylus TaxID=9590 RepID=UPI003007833B
MVFGYMRLSPRPLLWSDDHEVAGSVKNCRLSENISSDDMLELGNQFSHFINNNVDVPGSVYTKCCFDLCTLAHNSSLYLPFCLLDIERAWELKVVSRLEDKDFYGTANKRKRSLSSDDLIDLQCLKAILS